MSCVQGADWSTSAQGTDWSTSAHDKSLVTLVHITSSTHDIYCQCPVVMLDFITIVIVGQPG